jgi:hypothetical protein
MAKLNLDEFKNNAETVIAKQERSGIFKENLEAVETIPLDALDESLTIRRLPRDNDILERSIRHLGQLEPIIVRRKGDIYEVLDGARRVAVARGLGRADIAAEVVDVAYDDAIFLPYLLNTPEGFDPVEIALYIRRLTTNGIAADLLEEKTGLKVSDYRELFFTPKSDDIVGEFNDHFHALLREHFKLRGGKFRLEKNGVSLDIGIDRTQSDARTEAEVYRFIHRLGNL